MTVNDPSVWTDTATGHQVEAARWRPAVPASVAAVTAWLDAHGIKWTQDGDVLKIPNRRIQRNDWLIRDGDQWTIHVGPGFERQHSAGTAEQLKVRQAEVLRIVGERARR
jgi:hypothetical protein